MGYSFQSLVPMQGGGGRGPDFPEEIGFLLLADCRSAEWGLYEHWRDEDADGWHPEEPVSRELAALIESGKRHPPALALARHDVSRMFLKRQPTRDEFAAAYAESLRRHLGRQPSSRFILARAARQEAGYLTPGEWLWVLRASQADPPVVSWVSDDYFVYDSPAADFDLTKKQLRSLRAAGDA